MKFLILFAIGLRLAAQETASAHNPATADAKKTDPATQTEAAKPPRPFPRPNPG